MKNSNQKLIKNNKGVTLIALAITIILLLILATVGTVTGMNSIKSSQFTKFTTELKIMQTQVNDLYQKYKDSKTIEVGGNTYTGEEILNIGKDISSDSNVSNQANKVFTSEKSGITDKTGYRYFDKQTIKDLKIEGVEEEFFINIDKRSIVSYEGFIYEGKDYYTLDQVPKGFYNVEYDKSAANVTFEVNSEIIEGKGKIHIFNISTNKYINKWQVRYRLKTGDGKQENTWNTTEEFEGSKTDIDVEKLGKYEVQVFNDGEILSEIKETEMGLQIGDYVNYIYDIKQSKYNLPITKSGYVGNQEIVQTRGLKWRILNINEDGNIDLISELPTDQGVSLKGAKGYNNGVYLINEICKEQYSNRDLGIEARNLNLSDVEKQFSEEGIDAMIESRGGGNQKYPINKKYPNLYAKEFGSGIDQGPMIDGIDRNENGVTEEELTKEPASNEAKNSLLVTNTYYSFSNTLPSYFEDYKSGISKFFNVIFETKKEFWLSSRFANCYSDNAGFGVVTINNSSIKGSNLFYSVGDQYSYQFFLRPVVSLGENVQVIPSKYEANGTDIEHMHQIIKNQS